VNVISHVINGVEGSQILGRITEIDGLVCAVASELNGPGHAGS